ncbi:DUF11 domain-containing protein [Candidatus Parcubacteria bacterium]|nr:DUF11 domain-containing protein [Candidatus Parcubacteria bacterium]
MIHNNHNFLIGLNKSRAFLRGIRPRRKDLGNANSSPQQAAGYSGKVRDKKPRKLGRCFAALVVLALALAIVAPSLEISLHWPTVRADSAGNDPGGPGGDNGAPGGDNDPQQSTPPIVRSWTMDQFVRNVSQGGGFAQSITANSGDTLQFRFVVTAAGNAPITGITFRLNLPNQLQRLAGTAFLEGPGGRTQIDHLISVITNATVRPGETYVLELSAAVPPASTFSAGTTSMISSPTMEAPGMVNLAAAISIAVMLPAPPPPPPPPPPQPVGVPALNILAQVKNISRAESTLRDRTGASPGESITFSMRIDSVGTAPARNVLARDFLPAGFTFEAGSTRIDFNFAAGDPTSGFFSLGDLAPGQSRTLHFTARVATGFFAAGTNAVTNVAVVQADSVSQRQATAFVDVTVASPPPPPTGTPALAISKLGRNLSRGEATLQRTVNAAPGEDVLWSIRVDSIGSAAARNVIVRDSLPWQASYRTGSSRLESNAVADGIVNGGINIGDLAPGQNRIVAFQTTVGGSNLFVPGINTLTNFAFARADGLPNETQDSAQLAVTVPAAAPPPPAGGQPSLALTKSTRNLSRNEVGLVRVTNASPLETVEFSVRVSSTGTAPAQNISVQDFLPGGLTLISGSVRLDGNAQPDAIATGIAVGTMPSGTSRTLTFQANVRDASFFAAGVTTLTNFATANASSASSQSDTANVLVTVNPAPVPSPNLSVFKTVRNVTRNEISFVKSTGADPAQELEFSIRIDSTGTTSAQNVTVSDFLDRMTYVAGTTRLDNATTTDGIASGGLAIGPIPNGTSRTVMFRAQIRDASQFAAGTSVLTNTATASATNVPIRQDTATIIVTVGGIPPGGTPNLNIFKQIRNATRGESFAKSTSADPGQELEFSVRIDSNGTAPTQNVRVADALPGRLTYLSGTTRIDGAAAADGIASGGLTLGTVPSSTTRTVTYRVRIADRSQFSVGQTVLNNFATASADNTFSRQDTSSVLISISSGSFGNPSISLTKRVANGNRPNGSDFFNEGRANDQLTYTIELRNTGTADLTNALIDDYLPSNTAFVSVSGNGFLSASNQVRWFMGTIGPGSASTVSYTVRINSGLTDGISITNRAQARADNFSQTDSNEVTTVIRETATTTNLQKTVDRPQARRGETLTYTINYLNTNNVDVRSLVFTDVLPPWVSLISATPQPTSVSGQQLEWRLASVAPGGSVNLTIRTRISQSAPNGTTMTNVATLTSVNPHPRTAQAQASTTVIPEEVAVAKTTLPPTGAGKWVSTVVMAFVASVAAVFVLYRRFVVAVT